MALTNINASVVTDVLIKPHIAHIEFTLDGASVSPTRFGDVKRAIDNGDIGVKRDSTLSSTSAVYIYKPSDYYKLGFTSTGGSADLEALIVHESVHAIFDVHASPQVVKTSEAAAYVAQMLYFYHANKAAIDGGASPTFATDVQREAWELSVDARGGSHTYTAGDAADLYTAIENDRRYSSRAGDTEDYDGV